MKLTFPNMGNMSILLGALMRELGLDFVPPGETRDSTCALGVKYAPSGACMPMKIILGGFIEANRLGADTGIFFGGKGPCCFGYFAESFNLIFRKNNIPMKILTLEKDLGTVKQVLTLLKNESSFRPSQAPYIISTALKCAEELDRLEDEMLAVRASLCRKQAQREFESYRRRARSELKGASGLGALLTQIQKCFLKLSHFEKDFEPYIKIALVGDIYTLLDPFINKDIRYTLACRGVLTQCSVTLYGWLCEKLKRTPAPWNMYADKYMPYHIGGFARQSLGYAAASAARGADGIIEIYPMNCMPEIAAKGILPAVGRDFSVPILTLVLDEMSASEGYNTRIEAFTDMIERKRKIHDKLLSRC